MSPQKPSFSRDTIFKRSNDFVHRINPDNSVILVRVSEDDEFFKITGVAFFIWQSIDGVKSLGQILDSILSEYDVTPEKLDEDSIPFLNRLIDLKIISPS